jgi:hypothetical protein
MAMEKNDSLMDFETDHRRLHLEFFHESLPKNDQHNKEACSVHIVSLCALCVQHLLPVD